MVIVLTPVKLFLVQLFLPIPSRCSGNRVTPEGRQTALAEEMIGNQKVVRALDEEKSSERFGKRLTKNYRNAV